MVLLAIFMGGCRLANGYDHTSYPNIHLEETVRLAENDNSPYLDISIDYAYLNEEGDSIALRINRDIQRELLGEGFTTLTPQIAVDSFKHTRIHEYRAEVGELYRADIAKNGTDTPVPAWYNQTYSLTTFIEEGHEGHVLNLSANYFVDMGGAHPNQWSRWMNFDFVSGKLLKKKDVFKAEAKQDIEQLLLDKLIRKVADLNPEENVTSLEDLKKQGFLQMTDIYIPDNFLLTKKGVLFLFNRYDIAPYSAGETVLEVPYEEIGIYLNHN